MTNGKPGIAGLIGGSLRALSAEACRATDALGCPFRRRDGTRSGDSEGRGLSEREAPPLGAFSRVG